MSKYDKDSPGTELRLMEVKEDTTSMLHKDYLKNKFIAPPSWDFTPAIFELGAGQEDTITKH